MDLNSPNLGTCKSCDAVFCLELGHERKGGFAIVVYHTS